MVYAIQNPAFNAFGSIDVEVQIESGGAWYPYTAQDQTGDAREQQIYNDALALGPAAYVEPPAAPITSVQVDRERDRRLALGTDITVAGYSSNPIAAQLRPGTNDASNMLGQVVKAQMLISAGDLVTTLRWRDGNNTIHTLTALQMIDFGTQSADWVDSVHGFAWSLKDSSPIPTDYADDSRWQ